MLSSFRRLPKRQRVVSGFGLHLWGPASSLQTDWEVNVGGCGVSPTRKRGERVFLLLKWGGTVDR